MSGSGVGTNVYVFRANAIHAGTRYKIKGSGNRVITYVYVFRADYIHTVTRHEIIARVGRGT